MISKKTRYALNALAHLARRYNQGPVLISQIAEQEHIPQKFLEAILLDLRNAGILSSKKGKGGGYYLLKTPEDVTLAQVMRLLDGPIALLPCVSANYYERCDTCQDEETCGIRSVFKDVHQDTLRILEGTTLAEIVSRGDTNPIMSADSRDVRPDKS
ncbi:MAG: Rrf2 family transcriptional regulator [Bacteroidia bacterium]|nr:Rrf2 family transcriptional regulator [Bacteroidia bacterium]